MHEQKKREGLTCTVSLQLQLTIKSEHNSFFLFFTGSKANITMSFLAPSVQLSSFFISKFRLCIIFQLIQFCVIKFLFFILRFKGKYQYDFAGHKCPAGVTIKSNASYVMYGKLSGLSGDDFAYVKQASSSVTLHDEESNATADICFRGNRNGPYCMYLAFRNHQGDFTRSCKVKAEFNLKESYFKNLISSIHKLNIVSRLMPSDASFCNPRYIMEDVECCKDSCSDEQFEALKVIINTAPSSPPILLTGAFGTGKSTLLATCALYLLSKSSKTPIRILVCTQQRYSADVFLKLYTNKFWVGKNKNVFVIREYGYDRLDPDLKEYYQTSVEFKNILSEMEENESLLVITTCLTAPHLHFLPQGYFTHIFIDKGSHMREPEAIAPLQFATEETKIVIAGDSNQVYCFILY